MENLVKQSSILEKSGVYSEDGKHRYELSLIYKGIKGKKILVISFSKFFIKFFANVFHDWNNFWIIHSSWSNNTNCS